MRASPVLALIGATAVFLGLGGIAQPISDAEYLGTYVWSINDPGFGGFSGLELSSDGRDFVAVSDRGNIITGQLRRDGVRIAGVDANRLTALKNTKGGPLGRFEVDGEGLAVRADGRIYVSFEAVHRVSTYRDPTSEASWLPQPREFTAMQNNSSLEALAIDAGGAIYTLPERSGKMTRPFPVYRYRGGK